MQVWDCWQKISRNWMMRIADMFLFTVICFHLKVTNVYFLISESIRIRLINRCKHVRINFKVFITLNWERVGVVSDTPISSARADIRLGRDLLITRVVALLWCMGNSWISYLKNCSSVQLQPLSGIVLSTWNSNAYVHLDFFINSKLLICRTRR